MLDDEAGAFLTRTEHFEAAARIVQVAESTSVILRQDSELLARLYLNAEAEILRLFEDAPEDIRQAVAALIDDLRRLADNNPANLPEKPKERFDHPRRSKEGEFEDEN